MIGVEARGRLGNQMFQFAFGLAAADRLGTDFVYAEDELRRLFELTPRRSPTGRARRALEYRLARALSPYSVVNVGIDADPADVMAALTDRTTYIGYFQSERYFDHLRERVVRAFAPRRAVQREFERRYEDLLAAPYTCCHVRATDYREFEGGIVLPPSYYRDALRELGVERGPIVFVGDDLTEMRESFEADGVRFEQNSELVDLLLIQRAAAVVTSNSSFAWWGAWLGARDRRVISPRHWIGLKRGYERPRDVIPDRWTQVTVAI